MLGKKLGCLFAAALMVTTTVPVAAFASTSSLTSDAQSALATSYTYENNGYVLEKVSHADSSAGETDGFVDYYEYTDPNGTICTGVTEHIYVDGGSAQDTAAELEVIKGRLEAKYPNASDTEIDRMVSEAGASLDGDACQSYAFSALGYGDWVYIGTMYGGTGINKKNAKTMLQSMGLLKDESTDADAAEYNQKMVDSVVGLLYGDNYYTEHPVATQGILFKMNVKTGETKIIMAGSVNGYQVTLRNAVEYNGRFYFIGTQVGTENVADAATGIPSIFEVNPEDDSFRTVYQAVTMDEYRAMQSAYVFPIPRALTVYQGSLIASVTQMDGAHIISYTPDADDFNEDGSFKGINVDGDSALRNPEFTEIAEQSKELLNYPAYHMYDANYGGTVYQMIEYNGKLYMAINAGQKALRSTLNPEEGVYTAVDPDTLEETGCYAGYAILEGTLKDGASPSDRDAWTWTPIVGNTADDQWDNKVNSADDNPAMYTFNIDSHRFAAAICTMEVYNGYLYIGDYNDVTQATYPMLNLDFVHLSTVLSQSVNLYRMDGNHNIELVVGDATEDFPDGSLTGWESGYGSRINQYTSMTKIWDTDKTDDNDGVMLLGTLDEGSLLRPMIKVMNGDVLKMSKSEWVEKLNYVKVLVQLLLQKGVSLTDDAATVSDTAPLADTSAESLDAEQEVAQALAAAQAYDAACGVSAAADSASDDAVSSSVVLTDEQTASLVEDIKNGSIKLHSMAAQSASDMLSLAYGMDSITNLVDASGQENIDAFYQVYKELVDAYQEYMGQGDVVFPESLQKIFDQVLNKDSAKQLRALLTCLNAVKTSVVGCDTYAITSDSDGSNINIDTITLDGLGDDSNQTMRNFAITDDYVVLIPGNAIRGGSVYRLVDWPNKKDDPEPEPETYTVTYDANGGSGSVEDSGQYEAGESATVLANGFVREGYAFCGWNTAADGSGASYQAGENLEINGDVTLYAQWTKNGSDDGEKDDTTKDDGQKDNNQKPEEQKNEGDQKSDGTVSGAKSKAVTPNTGDASSTALVVAVAMAGASCALLAHKVSSRRED